MSNNHTCPLCSSQVELLPISPVPHTKCPNCGTFIEVTFTEIYFQVDAETKTKIVGWIADQNRIGIVPSLSGEMLKRASARPLPTVVERAERLLLQILQHKNKLGDRFSIGEVPRLLAATYSQNSTELTYLVQMLEKCKWLVPDANYSSHQITPRGHIEADKLTRKSTQSAKAFVAMSFHKKLGSVYEKGFQVGIINAGYDPFRIDKKEHADKIDDEIISEIKTAALVVADFTKHRGGVYFEAGFGLGLNLPVIWTCNKNDKKPLHFDIRQYNMIFWDDDNYEEFALRLQRRIEAVVGKGPKQINFASVKCSAINENSIRIANFAQIKTLQAQTSVTNIGGQIKKGKY